MKKKSRSVTAVLAGVVLALAAVASPASAISMGARYCNYGYDAIQTSTIKLANQWVQYTQTSSGVTHTSAKVTNPLNAPGTFVWNYGSQSFSSSTASGQPSNPYTYCA